MEMASYERAGYIEDATDHLDPDDVPFNDIFKGKWRTIVPLGKSITKGTKIEKIITWLEQQGYEVDFKTGLASKGFQSYTGKPGAPGTEIVTRIKHQKIGKVLQRAATLNKKARSTAEKARDFAGEWYRERGSAVMEPPYAKEYEVLQDAESKASEDYEKHFRHRAYGHYLEEWVEFWNKESRFYRENPDKIMTDYSIIVTRKPMDVLRMSDFDLIESCHSLAGDRREGGEFEWCALKSAKSGEILAFVVETQDLQEVDDLQDDEIFEDDERSVPGIEPIARVRVRRFVKKYQSFSDNQYELAVPERSTYGTGIPNFYEKVREWALETQKDKWEEVIGEDGKAQADYLRDFVMKGGHYRDTHPRIMFGKLFAEYGGDESFQYASGGDWDDDEEEEKIETQGGQRAQELINMAEDYEYRCANTERNYNFDHVEFHYEIQDPHGGTWDNDTDPYEHEEGWEPQVSMYGSMKIEIELDGPEADEFPLDDQGLEKLANSIKSALSFSNETDWYQLKENYGTAEFFIEFVPYYHDPDPDGFEGFCKAMEEDDNDPDLFTEMRGVLVELGYAKPTRVDKLRAQVNSGEIELDNFEVTLDNEGGYNLEYPMEKEVFLIGPTTGDIRGILGVTYGDTRDLRGSGDSFTSNKFKTEVLNQLTKYFTRAAQETNKQLQMALEPDRGTPATRAVQKGEEGRIHANYPLIKPEEIQKYIADGFVLGLERLHYTSAVIGTDPERESRVGEPRKARVTVLRFVLEDDAPEGFPDDQADDLMAAAIKFVQYLDKDIEQLRHAINGVLQTTDKKVSGQITAADGELADMFEELKVMHTIVIAEIEKLERQAQSSRPARSAHDLEKWVAVQHLIDDLLIDVSASKKPQTILRYISDFRFTYQTRLKTIKNKVSQIETVEELSRLFESAPNLMRLIREEVEAALYS